MIAWQMASAGGKVPLVHPAERFRLDVSPGVAEVPHSRRRPADRDGDGRRSSTRRSFRRSTSPTWFRRKSRLEGFGESEVKLDKDTVVIKAKATSAKHPITTMRLLVNGRPSRAQRACNASRTPSPATIPAVAQLGSPRPAGHAHFRGDRRFTGEQGDVEDRRRRSLRATSPNRTSTCWRWAFRFTRRGQLAELLRDRRATVGEGVSGEIQAARSTTLK